MPKIFEVCFPKDLHQSNAFDTLCCVSLTPRFVCVSHNVFCLVDVKPKKMTPLYITFGDIGNATIRYWQTINVWFLPTNWYVSHSPGMHGAYLAIDRFLERDMMHGSTMTKLSSEQVPSLLDIFASWHPTEEVTVEVGAGKDLWPLRLMIVFRKFFNNFLKFRSSCKSLYENNHLNL